MKVTDWRNVNTVMTPMVFGCVPSAVKPKAATVRTVVFMFRKIPTFTAGAHAAAITATNAATMPKCTAVTNAAPFIVR